jgi:hypothetical protein
MGRMLTPPAAGKTMAGPVDRPAAAYNSTLLPDCDCWKRRWWISRPLK